MSATGGKLRSKYGCRFVSVKTAARVIGVPEEAIVELVRRKLIRGLQRDDEVRVQIPAAQRRMSQLACLELVQP